jgi:hypothetical protein
MYYFVFLLHFYRHSEKHPDCPYCNDSELEYEAINGPWKVVQEIELREVNKWRRRRRKVNDKAT